GVAGHRPVAAGVVAVGQRGGDVVVGQRGRRQLVGRVVAVRLAAAVQLAGVVGAAVGLPAAAVVGVLSAAQLLVSEFAGVDAVGVGDGRHPVGRVVGDAGGGRVAAAPLGAADHDHPAAAVVGEGDRRVGQAAQRLGQGGQAV